MNTSSFTPADQSPGATVIPPQPPTPSEESTPFVDRRQAAQPSASSRERRQFGSTHRELSAEGRELALAIDRYKVDHHRRYLTCDELLGVIASLGYRQS